MRKAMKSRLFNLE